MPQEIREGIITTSNNVNVGVFDSASVAFFKKGIIELPDAYEDEAIRLPGDEGYGVCICGGQGDCLGCEEREIESMKE